MYLEINWKKKCFFLAIFILILVQSVATLFILVHFSLKWLFRENRMSKWSEILHTSYWSRPTSKWILISKVIFRPAMSKYRSGVTLRTLKLFCLDNILFLKDIWVYALTMTTLVNCAFHNDMRANKNPPFHFTYLKSFMYKLVCIIKHLQN
jgi:hypothetical protein